MHTLSLSDFRARASETISLVEKGESVRILRHGKPVAELVPVQPHGAAEPLPSYKQPFEPVRVVRPDGKTGSQLIIDERESGW